MIGILEKLKQPKLLAAIGGVIVAVAICVVLVNASQNPAGDDVSITDWSHLGDMQPEDHNEDNDILAAQLATGEYAETVLERTADAGASYAKETLFIGDSNTAGMLLHSNITNVTMDNGIGIVSMGISHVTTLRCVKFRGMEAVTVPDAVKLMQPRRIVITYGTNDYYMTPEKFIENYDKALDAITDAYPYADIIIGSIFPITSNSSYYTVSMPTIERFNLELVKLAQEKGVRFLNWSESMKDPSTGFSKPEYMSGDGVHLSRSGMEQISSYFRTHSLSSEDRRPKPLFPVPAREPTPAGLLGQGPRTLVEAADPEENQGVVSVTFSAGAGGSLTSGGASGQSITLQVAPGATAGPVTARPNAGYVFVGWSGAASSSSSSISFTVPADATPGQSFALTAVFALDEPAKPDPQPDPEPDPPPDPEPDPPPDPEPDPEPDPPPDPEPDPIDEPPDG